MTSVATWGILNALLQAILLAGGVICAAFSYYMVSGGRRSIVGAWFLWAFGVILPQIAIFALGMNVVWELFLIMIGLITLIACISKSCCGNSGCGSSCGSSCGSCGNNKRRRSSDCGDDDECCSSGCGSGCGGCSGCGDSNCCDDGKRRKRDYCE